MGRPYVSLFFIALVVLPGQTERVEVEMSTVRHRVIPQGEKAVEDFLCGSGAVLKKIRSVTEAKDGVKFHDLKKHFWDTIDTTLKGGLNILGQGKGEVERALEFHKQELDKIAKNAHQMITEDTVDKMFSDGICVAFDYRDTGAECPITELTTKYKVVDLCKFARDSQCMGNDNFIDALVNSYEKLDSKGEEDDSCGQGFDCCQEHLDKWHGSTLEKGGKADTLFKEHANTVLKAAGLDLSKPMDIDDGLFITKCTNFYSGCSAICDHYDDVLKDIMGRQAMDKSADPGKHKQAIKDNEALLVMFTKKIDQCSAAIGEFSTMGADIAIGVDNLEVQEGALTKMQMECARKESQLTRATVKLEKLQKTLEKLESILKLKTAATEKAQEEVTQAKQKITAAIIALQVQLKVVQDTQEKLELVKEIVNEFSSFKDSLSFLLGNLVQSYKRGVSKPVIDGGLTADVDMVINFKTAISDAKPALVEVAKAMHDYCQEGTAGGFDYAAARAVDAAGDVAKANAKGVEHMCKGMFDWTKIPDQLSAIAVAKQRKAANDIESIQGYVQRPDDIGDLKDGLKERQDEGEPANLRNAIAIYSRGQSPLIQYATAWRADKKPKTLAGREIKYPMKRFGRLLRVFKKTSMVWKEVAQQLELEQQKALECEQLLAELQAKLPELEKTLATAIKQEDISREKKDAALAQVNKACATVKTVQKAKKKADEDSKEMSKVFEENKAAFQDQYEEAVQLSEKHDA